VSGSVSLEKRTRIIFARMGLLSITTKEEDMDHTGELLIYAASAAIYGLRYYLGGAP